MSNITYTYSLDGITADQVAGLRAEWVTPPSPEVNLRSLRNMNAVVLAVDEDAGQVVGFVCGMTDDMLILYVWDEEVLPAHRGTGIRGEIYRRFLDRYGEIYQINANPSADRRALFEQLGFVPYHPDDAVAMTRMRMDLQAPQTPTTSRDTFCVPYGT